MKYIKNTLSFETQRGSVVTLGKFDGLHRGHMLLVNRVLEVGRQKGLETVIFTFAVPPSMRVAHEPAHQLLTNDERHLRLEGYGVDMLIECPFSDAVMHMEPEAFIREILVEKLHAACVVVGTDFRFGYQRRGDVRMLETLGPSCGFRTEIIQKAREDGREISSTWIKEELRKGRMETVERLLGYPYTVREEIVHGRALGRTIGVPTINQVPVKEKLLPPYGVYVSRVKVGGQEFYGMTNIGVKPTVKENFTGVETYLFDCGQDLYGQMAEVALLHFQRREQKFPSVEALQEHLKKDEKQARQFLRENYRV
ncbi:MAG TPA: bifunctional riboflavin kinase/FAD synthetase [Candidatus Fusicatenibacter merdavium]|uniref:Riboflavin biosynthesis protein n=1 Tax=Candidatus Fusicatenibacter merdavium TaxID=2838600 RepID=A0A9D1XCH2_9FIRM|nr:bifunctional riboflavin kinase/FAD synthetase [Candidatus Fusicatenibacter merdavium]